MHKYMNAPISISSTRLETPLRPKTCIPMEVNNGEPKEAQPMMPVALLRTKEPVQNSVYGKKAQFSSIEYPRKLFFSVEETAFKLML